jgi:hypothetical protein
MRFEIGPQGWPIAGGARLIPVATIVGDGGIPLAELPSPLPPDVVALDDAAHAQMREWYPDHIHMLRVGPDVGKKKQRKDPDPMARKSTRRPSRKPPKRKQPRPKPSQRKPVLSDN